MLSNQYPLLLIFFRMSINQGSTNQNIDFSINDLSKDLSAAVHKVKDIQQLVNSFIDAIVIRKNDETEKETQTIKLTIKKVRDIRVELETLGNTYAKLRLNNIHPIPLGNAGYVSLDPSLEQNGFYKQLLDCYTWLQNIDQDATKVLNHYNSRDAISVLFKEKAPITQTLKEMIANVKANFPDLSFNDSLVVPECCLVVTVGKAFVISIIFSGLVVSHVVTKSMLEIYTVKPWDHSEHLVFKKMSDIFSCTIMNFIHLEPKELLHSVLNYISSYKDIYNKKCKICGKHLNSESTSSPMMPPIWKDLKDDIFYHLSCK